MEKMTPTERIKVLQKQVRTLKSEKQSLLKELVEIKSELAELKKSSNPQETNKSFMAQYVYEPIEKVFFEETFYEHPVLVINKEVISFDNNGDSISRIAKILFQPRHVKKLLSKNGVPLDVLYDWVKQKQEPDWYLLDNKSRKQFKKKVYQSIRHINTKANPITDSQKLIYERNNAYHMLRALKFIKK